MTDETAGALLAMSNVCATLLGELSLLKQNLTHKPANSFVEDFLCRLEAQLPNALAGLEQSVSQSASAAYEMQIERFSALCRETLSFT